MTGTSFAEDGVSRRNFVIAAGAAAVVGGAIGTTAAPAAAAVSSNEICRMDAVALAENIRTKQLSPTEVTEAVLARMEKLNPVLGAFCTPSPDVARAQAKAVETDIMAGKKVGPLAGVPVGIKDETAPGASGWESIEHIGPLTRTVADGALMMSVIASGPDDRDRRTVPNDVRWMEAIKGDIKGLRVAWTPDWGYAQVDPEVREVCATAAKVFADKLGCKVEEASPWKDDYFGHFFTIVLAETDLKGMRELVAKYGDRMQPHLVDAIKGTLTDEQITDAVVARKKASNQSWRFFRTYDLLLTPTIACVPFGHGIQGPELIEGKKADPFQWITFTYQFNMTGQPAATVPAGFTKDGLPIGLQIVGRHLDDALVLRAAAAYEAAAPWKDKWPPMLAQMGL